MLAGATQLLPAQVTFQVFATKSPMAYTPTPQGLQKVTYRWPTTTYNSMKYPLGSKTIVPVEIEVFKVVRDESKEFKVWNAAPIDEAVGDGLNDALAQDVFKSMENQEGALAEVSDAFQTTQAAFEDELEFSKPFLVKEEEIVRLNVLGSLVDVSLGVVRLHEEPMLATIFVSNKWKSQPQNLDENGRYFLVSEGMR